MLTSGNELVKTGALSDNWNPGENCNSDNHQMFHLFAFEGGFIVIEFPIEVVGSNEPDEHGVPNGDNGVGDVGLA